MRGSHQAAIANRVNMKYQGHLDCIADVILKSLPNEIVKYMTQSMDPVQTIAQSIGGKKRVMDAAVRVRDK